VFWRGEKDGSLEEPLGAEQTGQTKERAVYPALLLGSDGEFRLGYAKHERVIAEYLTRDQTA
jgi:hypothetical protein